MSDVVDTVQEYFDTHQYGLFDKRPDKETDGVRLYYVASPELVKTVEDNRGYYLYQDWLVKNTPSFTKKGLRDISRYYSSKTLDSTALYLLSQMAYKSLLHTPQKVQGL